MHSEDEIVEICKPSDLVKVEETVDGGPLSKKSKQRYDRTYNEFEGWRKRNGAVSLSEHTLLKYFLTLRESNKPTTLWAYYSMLKSTLNHNHSVDISSYVELTSFLKRQSEGYRAKKAKAFTKEEMRSFISEAPDSEWLAVKVACIFGMCGALRTDDLMNINVDDVKMYSDMAYVRINDSKNKEPRSFTVTDHFFEIVKKYRDFRPVKVHTDRFFVSYTRGKCTGHVIGKKSFSKMPSQIATYLNLEDASKYTGHAFRRSTTIQALKRDDNWKSSSDAKQYMDSSLMCRKRLGNYIESAINMKAIKVEVSDEEEHDSDEHTNNSIISIENPEINQAVAIHLNPTINFNEKLEVLVDPSNFQFGDVNTDSVLSHGRTNIVFPRPNGDGEISTHPFTFNNCNVTINYYQK